MPTRALGVPSTLSRKTTYGCPVQSFAPPIRLRTRPRNRSVRPASGATLNRAEWGRGDWVPRKSPDKPNLRHFRATRKRWSGACALCTRRANQRFDGGGDDV